MGTAQIKKLPVEHDAEDDDSLYPSRMHSSVRRYKPTQSLPAITPLPVTPTPSSPSEMEKGTHTKSSAKRRHAPDEPETLPDYEEDDEQEPQTQLPFVPRRRASLEQETAQEPSTLPPAQAVRPSTGHLPEETGRNREALRSPTGKLRNSTASTARSVTAPLKDEGEKAVSERAASAKVPSTMVPSAKLSGSLPDTDALPRMGRKPVVALLIGMVAAILLVMMFGAFSSWWHTYQDDLRYGRPRTFQMDAVVGHGDSPQHKTHFIFLNLNRHVQIIEIDGGDPAHTHIYVGPILFGDNQDLTPITGEIRDVNGDGKPDLILHIQDQQLVYLNNGTSFVPASSNP